MKLLDDKEIPLVAGLLVSVSCHGRPSSLELGIPGDPTQTKLELRT